MSDTKIEKQLLKPRPISNGKLVYTPVLLADSKGNYLRHHIKTGTDFKIQWWCKGGSRVQESLLWLKNSLPHKLRRHGKIALYIWLGTCDLTEKNKAYTNLRSEDFSTVDYLERKFNELVDFVHQFAEVKLTIL